MRGGTDRLAGRVVTDLRGKLLLTDGDTSLSGRRTEIEDIGHVDLAGDDAALEHRCRQRLAFVELVIDEVAVRLDDDAVAWSTEIQDLVCPACAPSSARSARCEFFPAQRGMAFECASHADGLDV